MSHRATLAFVFCIVLIDMLSFGIAMPVLPGLIMELRHVPVATAAEYAGWLGAGYAVTQFICAPVIGNLSDRFGRRPVMLAAVLAMALDYVIQAVTPAFWWLAIGRIAAGMTGASFTAAYATIADITPPERRSANFGLMGLAFGIGFVVGPAMGGLLGAISPRLPFYAAAALALANFLFGLVFLRESLPPDRRRAFDWRRANAFSALRSLRGQNATVLWFVAALGTWQLAHVVYPAAWSYFAIAAYGFSVTQVGIALALVGLSSALVQGVGLRIMLPLIGERRAVLLGVAGFVAAALLYAVIGSVWQVYLAVVISSVQGFVHPSISGLNSQAIDARSQGELQGATQSIGSIAQIIGPPLYTQALARFSGPGALIQFPAMPMVLAAVIALVALALFLKGLSRLPEAQVSSSTSQ